MLGSVAVPLKKCHSDDSTTNCGNDGDSTSQPLSYLSIKQQHSTATCYQRCNASTSTLPSSPHCNGFASEFHLPRRASSCTDADSASTSMLNSRRARFNVSINSSSLQGLFAQSRRYSNAGFRNLRRSSTALVQRVQRVIEQKEELRGAKTAFIIVSGFHSLRIALLSRTVLELETVLLYHSGTAVKKRPAVVQTASLMLTYVNCLATPAIYFFRNTEFRTEVRKLIARLWHQWCCERFDALTSFSEQPPTPMSHNPLLT